MAITVDENVGVVDTACNPIPETNRQIIYGALRLVGAYASSDSPRQEQVDDAHEALVMMLKTWQIRGFTWLRTLSTINAVSGQTSYNLPGSHTSTFRPTRVHTVTRNDVTSGYTIPMSAISRTDYVALPNKAATGTPVQYYYDPQTGQGKLYIWPAFDNSTDTLTVSSDKPLYAGCDMASFPGEWIEAIKYGLACRIAPEYGISAQERQLLVAEYSSLEQALLDYDREPVSTFLGVSYR